MSTKLLSRSCLLVAVAIGALACSGRNPSAGVQQTCAAPQVGNGTGCSDLLTDAANCGGIGVSCGGEACMQGNCACGGQLCPRGASCVAGVCQCAASMVRCGDVCTDVSNDEDHCGSCGRRCGPAGTCISGQCECTPPQPPVCEAGLVICDVGACRACVDLSADMTNCGACGRDCNTHQTCVSGVCQCKTEVCADPQVTCTSGGCSYCVVLATDMKNCGRCGASCDPDLGACTSGVCTCPGSLVWSGGRCRDLTRDPSNCGGIGSSCRNDQQCSAGACVCRAGLEDCAGQCVELVSNDNNCGTCGHACTGAATGGDFCSQGVCVTGNCASQTPSADACDPNGQSCVTRQSFSNDPLNCGQCDRRCDRDQVCTAGRCRNFTIGRECTSCPCVDCSTDRCCTYPGSTSVICVNGATTCP